MRTCAYVRMTLFRNSTVLLSFCPWDDAKIQNFWPVSKFFGNYFSFFLENINPISFR